MCKVHVEQGAAPTCAALSPALGAQAEAPPRMRPLLSAIASKVPLAAPVTLGSLEGRQLGKPAMEIDRAFKALRRLPANEAAAKKVVGLQQRLVQVATEKNPFEGAAQEAGLGCLVRAYVRLHGARFEPLEEQQPMTYTGYDRGMGAWHMYHRLMERLPRKSKLDPLFNEFAVSLLSQSRLLLGEVSPLWWPHVDSELEALARVSETHRQRWAREKRQSMIYKLVKHYLRQLKDAHYAIFSDVIQALGLKLRSPSTAARDSLVAAYRSLRGSDASWSRRWRNGRIDVESTPDIDAMFRRALEDADQDYIHARLVVVAAQARMAGWKLASQCKFAQAAHAFEMDLVIQTSLRGPGNEYVALALFNLAKLFVLQGDSVRAVRYIVRAQEMHSKLLQLVKMDDGSASSMPGLTMAGITSACLASARELEGGGMNVMDSNYFFFKLKVPPAGEGDTDGVGWQVGMLDQAEKDAGTLADLEGIVSVDEDAEEEEEEEEEDDDDGVFADFFGDDDDDDDDDADYEEEDEDGNYEADEKILDSLDDDDDGDK